MNIFKTTKDHKKYWQERKIDWKTSYLDTWNHPHRAVLTYMLSQLQFFSLMEIGCGSGPNLAAILKSGLPQKQLGGIDINDDAVQLAKKTFKGGVFFTCPADDIMMTDKSADVLLYDMCLIYVDMFGIDKHIKEMKRVARKYVVLCEFHHKSWWMRMWLKWTSGYNAYDWEKKLKKADFYDVIKYKLTPEDWPGGNPQKTFGWIFIAKVPKK